MAFPQIETGYKPEFGLGALYQGFNAGNADSMAQEEILKSFLANQREEQMQPLDVQGKVFANMQQDLLAQQSQVQNNPSMLKSFADSKQAGYDEAIRKNEAGALLQPFIKQQLPLEQGAKTRNLDLANQVTQIDAMFDTAPPEEQQQLSKLRQNIVSRLGNTPELAGKTALEHVKGDWDYRRTVDAAEIAANARGANKGGDQAAKFVQDATKEIGILESALAKIKDKAGQMEFQQEFLHLPPEQRTQAYNTYVKELEARLAKARADREWYRKQSSVEHPPETTPTPKGAADLQAAILAELERRKGLK